MEIVFIFRLPEFNIEDRVCGGGLTKLKASFPLKAD
jgi:hypothetical protein